VDSSPSVDSAGAVYIGSWDFCVYKLRGSDGALQWKFKAGGEVGAVPAIGSGASLVFAAGDGLVQLIA
jgi:outer membrane protein assembly factor BamB